MAAVPLTSPTRIGLRRYVARPPRFIYDGATICSRRVSIFRRELLTFPTGCRAISGCFSFGDSSRNRLGLGVVALDRNPNPRRRPLPASSDPCIAPEVSVERRCEALRGGAPRFDEDFGELGA